MEGILARRLSEMDLRFRLCRRLYRGARQTQFKDFHHYALKLIKPWLKFDSAVWGLGANSERGTVVGSYYLDALPRAMMQDYAQVQNLDFLAQRVAAQSGRTVFATWDDPDSATARYAPIRAFEHKYGLAQMLSTALPEPKLGLGHFLTLFRSDPTNAWTEAERQLKERLFPHLVEAVMQARCLYLKQEGGACAQSDRCSIGD